LNHFFKRDNVNKLTIVNLIRNINKVIIVT